MEPPDTNERPVSCTNAIISGSHNREEDLRHPSKVPAAGRGNSEDGKYWINPSANQLYNACQRKNKKLHPLSTSLDAGAEVKFLHFSQSAVWRRKTRTLWQ